MPKKRMPLCKAASVVFCDIDDVITFDRVVGGKKKRVIDRRAIARTKKLVDRGFRVAFVTGKAADYLQREFIPILKEFGIYGKCLVYGEHGFYEVMDKRIAMVPNGEAFAKERPLLLAEIEAAAKRRGVELAFPENETKQVMFYFKAVPKKEMAGREPSGRQREDAKRHALENAKQELMAVIHEAVSDLETQGKLSGPIRGNPTKSGCDVYPATMSKGNAVDDALKKWKLDKYLGRAYGDMPGDREMASRINIRFFEITGKSDQFLKETSYLRLKFFGDKAKAHAKVRKRWVRDYARVKKRKALDYAKMKKERARQQARRAIELARKMRPKPK